MDADRSFDGQPQGAADLEVGLRAQHTGSWDVEMRFSSSSREESRADIITTGRASFDLDGLTRGGQGGPAAIAAYAETLTDGLFGDRELLRAFTASRAAAATANLPLRIRLLIAPSAYELHQLRWETLLDPESRTPLLTDTNVLFSRYLTSTDWRPVRLRTRSELRALVIVAHPSDLADFRDPAWPAGDRQFSPVDVDGEIARARRGLGPIRTEVLAGPGEASLSALVRKLREDVFDVVYLVCHGFIVRDEPQLVLEKEDGTTDIVHGRSLAQRIRELQHVPRLVVLASCQSAGSASAPPSTAAGPALGPQLVEIGVPAVLAMHGDITVATVEAFIPSFLGRLREHGRIDQAMTEARGEVRNRPDWYAPVLFMRLRSGRLWYAAGFGGHGFGKWPALLSDIYEGTCLPLLGPGMTDTLFGSRQELARDLADRYHYPLAPYSREDLPQVAQFLAVDQSLNFPLTTLRDHLIEAVRARLEELPDDPQHPMPEHLREIPRFRRSSNLLDQLIVELWRREHVDEADPFVLLAQLPLPVYVTTQPISLLAEALRAEGKAPRIESSRWNDDCPPSVFELEPDYRPSPSEPLVFHIFGHLQVGASVVLREDNYFEFLTRAASDHDAIPDRVRRAFVNSALLFLGFRGEDWDFRVLFHSIMQQEGGSRRKAHSHVAAQVDPEAGLTAEPEGARRYFESFFGHPHDVSIFWGSVDSFVRTLHERLEADRS